MKGGITNLSSDSSPALLKKW